jgi:uncharacterized glyoxalase superfamily protein PhnB
MLLSDALWRAGEHRRWQRYRRHGECARHLEYQAVSNIEAIMQEFSCPNLFAASLWPRARLRSNRAGRNNGAKEFDNTTALDGNCLDINNCLERLSHPMVCNGSANNEPDSLLRREKVMVNAESTERMTEPTKFLTAQPALHVADVERSYEFYARLGFEKHFQNQDLHLLIERDGVILHLATQMIASPSGCQIMVNSVDDLYAQATAEGMPMKFNIQDEFWGCRDFTIEDPDGNYVTFSQVKS